MLRGHETVRAEASFPFCGKIEFSVALSRRERSDKYRIISSSCLFRKHRSFRLHFTNLQMQPRFRAWILHDGRFYCWKFRVCTAAIKKAFAVVALWVLNWDILASRWKFQFWRPSQCGFLKPAADGKLLGGFLESRFDFCHLLRLLGQIKLKSVLWLPVDCSHSAAVTEKLFTESETDKMLLVVNLFSVFCFHCTVIYINDCK